MIRIVKVGLIRNPRSGRGAANRSWPLLEARLWKTLLECDLIVESTTSPGSATCQSERLAKLGCEMVIAAGGDGTVCDVMQGLLGTGAALAVLPLGTGNDFARTIGIGANVDAAIDAIAGGRRERIDVGRWEQEDRHGHFLNVAGCGFDAAVADRVNRGFRYLRGRNAYLAAVLQTLMTYKPTQLHIVVDGEEINRRAMLCALANARSYGGGMQIAPSADLYDGLLDLVLVGELGRLEFLMAFPRVLKGTHLSHPKVSHRPFQRIEIDSDPPVPFLVDGELLPPGKVTVEVVPKALDVVMPRLETTQCHKTDSMD